MEAKVEENCKLNKVFGRVEDEGLLVSCKYGSIRFTKIQRAGRKAMLAKELLNGWRIKIGSIINEK